MDFVNNARIQKTKQLIESDISFHIWITVRKFYMDTRLLYKLGSVTQSQTMFYNIISFWLINDVFTTKYSPQKVIYGRFLLDTK